MCLEKALPENPWFVHRILCAVLLTTNSFFLGGGLLYV